MTPIVIRREMNVWDIGRGQLGNRFRLQAELLFPELVFGEIGEGRGTVLGRAAFRLPQELHLLHVLAENVEAFLIFLSGDRNGITLSLPV